MFPNYNVMGVAKAALEATRPLSGRRPRPEEHPRERRVRRADQDARRRGICGFSSILHVYPRSRAAAAQRRDRRSGEAAAFLLSDAGKGITGEVLMVDAGFHVTASNRQNVSPRPAKLHAEPPAEARPSTLSGFRRGVPP